MLSLRNDQRLAANAVLNAFRTVLGILFPLITFPYVSRILGVDNLGTYNFSYSIVSYFILIAALGISTYGIREGAQYRDDHERITAFVSEIFSINVLSTIVSYLLLFLTVAIVPQLQSYKLAILILSIEIVSTTLGVAWVCNVFEDFLFITIRSLIIQVVSLILTFLLVRSQGDIYVYISITVLSNALSNILNFAYIRHRYCRFRLVTRIDWHRHMKPILVIFSTTVAVTIYVSADTTMLGFMATDHEVGLYSTAVKIYTIIKNVLAALLMVLIPRFSYMFANGKSVVANGLFTKMFNILTLIMVPLSVGLFFLSSDIILLISGSDYLNAASALKLLSIAVLFSLYAYMYTQCILIPLKREDVVFKATAMSAGINLLLNFVLIPFWGIDAAALTTIIAECITFAIAYHEGKKHIRVLSIKRNVLITTAGSIGVMFVCIFARLIDSYLIRILTSVIGSMAIYAFTLKVCRCDAYNDLLRLLKRRDDQR